MHFCSIHECVGPIGSRRRKQGDETRDPQNNNNAHSSPKLARCSLLQSDLTSANTAQALHFWALLHFCRCSARWNIEAEHKMISRWHRIKATSNPCSPWRVTTAPRYPGRPKAVQQKTGACASQSAQLEG
eukprot:3842647-Pleurochrysis_carterae.AAC.3